MSVAALRRGGPLLAVLPMVAALVLVPSGTAAAADGTTVRVSVQTGGAQSSGAASAPVVIGGAGEIAVQFRSDGADLLWPEQPDPDPGSEQLYIRLLPSNETVPVSDVAGGITAHDLSDGGEPVVAFISRTDDLAPEGAPDPHLCSGPPPLVAPAHCADVYAWGGWYRAGSPVRVADGLDGGPPDGDSYDVRFSDIVWDENDDLQGRLAFTSSASNLVAGDSPGSTDVFAVDVVSETVSRLTTGDIGGQMSGLAISADGRTVAIASSSDLDPATSTPGTRVFLIDTDTGVATALGLPGESVAPTLSADGRLVTFLTDVALVPGDLDGSRDAYLLDRRGGGPVLLSVGPGGTQVSGVSGAEVSDDGSTVVFAAPGGLVPEAQDTSVDHIYARHLATGAIQVVNVSDTGVPTGTEGAVLGRRAITADGSSVVFTTEDALVADDTNGTSDVYLRTLGDWPPPPPGTLAALDGEPVTVRTSEDGVSADQPVGLAIDVPGGTYGPLTASLEPDDPDDPTGYALFDSGLDTSLVLTGPSTTVTDPYVLRFTVDGSLLGTVAPADVQVFRNGQPVPDCTATTAAVPDPCVAAREAVGDDDALLSVRTSAFSTWSVGRLSYDVDGPFRPVDPLPVVNLAKAGSAVPVKFSLGGDRGLDVFVDGYPRTTTAPCAGSTDEIEETASPLGSALTYDSATDTYTWVWKTTKGTSGCRELTLAFRDGSPPLSMRFQFR